MAEMIEKKALLDDLKGIKETLVGAGDPILASVLNRAIACVEKQPVLDATPVIHARWLDMQEDEATEGMWRCSVCGSDRYFDIMTPVECGCYYCPNCGAKMDAERETE